MLSLFGTVVKSFAISFINVDSLYAFGASRHSPVYVQAFIQNVRYLGSLVLVLRFFDPRCLILSRIIYSTSNNFATFSAIMLCSLLLTLVFKHHLLYTILWQTSVVFTPMELYRFHVYRKRQYYVVFASTYIHVQLRGILEPGRRAQPSKTKYNKSQRHCWYSELLSWHLLPPSPPPHSTLMRAPPTLYQEQTPPSDMSQPKVDISRLLVAFLSLFLFPKDYRQRIHVI